VQSIYTLAGSCFCVFGQKSDYFRNMRKLIRHKQTKAFLTRDGEWTNDVRLAHDFHNDEAICVARETYELHHGGQVYFLFGAEPSDDFDFVVSLADL
jgi:hypothetical protein